MKEVTIKSVNSDEAITMMSDEVFDAISDDPDFIDENIAKTPPLCMVLPKDLNDLQINNLVSEYYVFVNEYDGEERLVVAGGFYKKPQKAFDKLDPELTVKCNTARKWVNSGNRDTPVLKELIQDPLCILVSEKLEDTRREILLRSWETIKVEHNNEEYDAIACIYLDSNYETGPGKVISQHMRLGG